MNPKDKEERVDLDNINKKDESLKDLKKVAENSNEQNENNKETKSDKGLIDIDDKYKFGWGSYSEKINGRFAMIGFLAIILIEIFSQQSFLKWAGLL